MTLARQTFFGLCAGLCRLLGRWTFGVTRFFDRAGDWFAERSR